MRLFVILGIGALVGCVGAHDPSATPPSTDVPVDPDAVTANVALPTVTARAHPADESGLCRSRASHVVDEPLLHDFASDIYSAILSHGTDGGFSIAKVDRGHAEVVALDRDGALRGPGVITLPSEDGGQVTDVIGTADGGFVALWAVMQSPVAYDTYFVRYDAAGTPTGRSEDITTPTTSPAALLSASAEGLDVVYEESRNELSGDVTWVIASLSLDDMTVSERGRIRSIDDEGPIGVRGDTIYTTGMIHDPTNVREGVARRWDRHGTLLSSTAVDIRDGWGAPQPFTEAASTAPGPSDTIVLARYDAIRFVREGLVTEVPSDIAMNRAVAWPGPDGASDIATVGFVDPQASADGGGDTIQIVDISSSSARGVVGRAELPPSDAVRDFQVGYSGSVVELVPTQSEDAYLVVVASQIMGDAVAFTCAERAP